MFPLGVASLILGYAVAYWGVTNLRNGGQGPSFATTLGLGEGGKLGKGDVGKLGKLSPNLTGQPPATTTSPGRVVET